MTMYTSTTHNIHVTVEPAYEESRSKPQEGQLVFSYKVTIKNNSSEVIQILRRSWVITDAFFNVETIEGEGLVGEQPIIKPMDSFSYTSFCPLKTSFGVMKGNFFAITDSGKTLKIAIPEFILAHPYAVQ